MDFSTGPHADFEVEAQGPTHRVDLYVGLRVGYESGITLNVEAVRRACHDWVRDHHIGVTFTPTTFLYPSADLGVEAAEEPGVIIGLILNPRQPRPDSAEGLTLTGIRLAHRLLHALEQERIYVVASDVTLVVRSRDSAGR